MTQECITSSLAEGHRGHALLFRGSHIGVYIFAFQFVVLTSRCTRGCKPCIHLEYSEWTPYFAHFRLIGTDFYRWLIACRLCLFQSHRCGPQGSCLHHPGACAASEGRHHGRKDPTIFSLFRNLPLLIVRLMAALLIFLD